MGKKEKILVTGTAGFIGFHLAKKLLELGHEVVGIDNINGYYDTNLKYARLEETGISRGAEEWGNAIKSSKFPNYTFIRLNLEDSEKIFELFSKEKFDKVVNLAAQAGVRYSLENPLAYIDSNVVGYMHILEACRQNKIKHFVYASSSSVYGDSDKMPLSVDDRVDNPVSLYAATKKSNELMAYTYSHLYNLPTTGLRFFTVYGPWGRPDMAYFLFTKAITEGQAIKVFNNGEMYRDFTYIDDIITGLIRVIDNPPKYEQTPYKIFNIGNSNPVKLQHFIEAIEKALNKKAEKKYLPVQPGDVLKTFADVSNLTEEVGYKPNTPVYEGVTKFVEWYKKNYSEK